jgi:hypothetical protein
MGILKRQAGDAAAVRYERDAEEFLQATFKFAARHNLLPVPESLREEYEPITQSYLRYMASINARPSDITVLSNDLIVCEQNHQMVNE